ncbi:MAG TPA: LacI family DNA-binding transcriptional regulator [Chitinophagaceae bacterium]|nr:LacI family DNA-binding transcriptional regulator [Chitinophagaceae bacterium]
MKQQHSSTIVDIAEELHVSPSTVSRALKNNPHISQKTKDKVKKMAQKMGYRRNSLAAGLRSKKSDIIGLIVPRVSMFFQSTIVTAIQNTIHASGYNVIVCQSNDSVELEKELVNTLFDSRVDGVIVSSTMFTEDFSHFDIFTKHQIPLVFYDRVPRDFPARIIRGKDYEGGWDAGNFLVERGCKNIAFINGLQTCNLYQDRGAGFIKALEDNHIKLNKNREFNHLLTKNNAVKTCEELFSTKPYPDGVFCANDTTAIEVHQYVRKLGLKIPEDIKIIGYSNDPRTEIIEPAMTSVEQYPTDMGAAAAKAILQLVQQKSVVQKQQEELIPTKLIVRSST